MAKPGTFDDEAKREARRLFDQGTSCNAIAKELGVAASTISRWAKAEGLTFNTAATEDAVAATRLSHAQRRAVIIDRLYTRTEKLLDRLEADTFDTLVPVGMGEMRTKSLNYVPSAEEKNFASSMAIYLERVAKLELLDDPDGVAQVESMLGRLAARFGLVSS